MRNRVRIGRDLNKIKNQKARKKVTSRRMKCEMHLKMHYFK